MKTLILFFSIFILSYNISLASEIPGGWDDFILGMSFKKAKNQLEKNCNKINKSHFRTGYNCGKWQGIKIDTIHLNDEGLPLFKKLSTISLKFNGRTDFISFHNKLSNKWEVTKEPYCIELKKRPKKKDRMFFITDRVEVPYHDANLSNIFTSCMAWYSKNLIQLEFRPPSKNFPGISIMYRSSK